MKWTKRRQVARDKMTMNGKHIEFIIYTSGWHGEINRVSKTSNNWSCRHFFDFLEENETCRAKVISSELISTNFKWSTPLKIYVFTDSVKRRTTWNPCTKLIDSTRITGEYEQVYCLDTHEFNCSIINCNNIFLVRLCGHAFQISTHTDSHISGRPHHILCSTTFHLSGWQHFSCIACHQMR